ncbi:DNA circularization protein [Blastomonas fulva]|uniref:DNA circularization protein n=1 Tax=Blastomonas fulva TaxID=1550728 RepID=UPI0025A40F73|nr:DNA circularization N-terminal domain-containing protein [Blastomonas fulva]MDM7928659.1 DNA circularization N-terminal domain-containing protein [Blastomonas fulva]MDM7964445.1 DNA circularization N-terminal domain-containing protein [Blastomonas fulva]
MTWRDQYQPGSFRGAAFRTEYHERTGGRRVVTHEFPGRDDPVTEDLGRSSRAFSIDCWITGADYRGGRDALIDALEAFGPGLLVHPFYGSMNVNVLSYRQTEDTEEGGMCRFSIEFVESGVAVAVSAALDGAALAGSEADDVLAGAAGAFDNGFDIGNVADFVSDAAVDLVTGAATLTQFVAAAQGGLGPALRAFDAGLRFLPDNIQSLLREPMRLGQAVVGLVSTVQALGSNGRVRVESFMRMTAFGDSLKPVIGTTPSRQRQADNQAAFVHLYTSAAAAELVRAASRTSFASYEDATAMRDRVSSRLDLLAMRAADAGNDDRAALFDGLRRAAVRDITQRGGTLARVHDLPIGATQPALRVANRLYGVGPASGGVEARAADIAARNRVRHPGFVPGGVTLKVLSAARPGAGAGNGG